MEIALILSITEFLGFVVASQKLIIAYVSFLPQNAKKLITVTSDQLG